MHSWQELRAEILQQEILELEEQPDPKDRSAYMEHQRRIRTLKRELLTLWAEERKLAIAPLSDMMGKILKSPGDVSSEEMVKIAEDLEKKIKRKEDFVEKSSKNMRAHMLRSWQRASMSQRGRIATVYGKHSAARGLRTISFQMLHFCLKAMRRMGRKWG